MNNFAISEDYRSFRASVQQKRVQITLKNFSVHGPSFLCFVLHLIFYAFKKLAVDDGGEKVWTVYDAGPKTVRCPIICLPPASGRADVFYKQILSLSAAGHRIIAVKILTSMLLKS